jgi:hypothetical protein
MRLFRNQRLPFAAILRPPGGQDLDRVVMTTYQLDLTAVLTVPIARYLHDRARGRSPSLVRIVERVGDVVHAYCQACRINVPRRPSRVLDHLRHCVTEMRPNEPFAHIHPKVMVVRFTGGRTPMYRIAVASRNITLEPNWYVLLVADGLVGRRRDANGTAVAELLNHLVAIEGFPHASRFVDELARVDFATPVGFDTMDVRTLGLDGPDSFVDLNFDELVVAAPLLSASVMRSVGTRLDDNPRVFTRRTTIDGLDDDLRRRCRLFGLGPLPATTGVNGAQWQDERPPQGVHFKAYVGRRGAVTHLVMGSANLTRGARERNIELMVELTSSDPGIDPASFADALLAPDERAEQFAPYRGAPTADAATTAQEESGVTALCLVEHALSDRERVPVRGTIDRGPQGFDVRLSIDLGAVTWPPRVEVRVAPVGLETNARLEPGQMNEVSFVSGAPPAGFVAFEVVVEGVEPSTFVTKCEWSDRPVGLLRDVLSNAETGATVERLVDLHARGAITLDEGRGLLRRAAATETAAAAGMPLWSAMAALADDPAPTPFGVNRRRRGATELVTTLGAAS